MYVEQGLERCTEWQGTSFENWRPQGHASSTLAPTALDKQKTICYKLVYFKLFFKLKALNYRIPLESCLRSDLPQAGLQSFLGGLT